LIQMSQYWPSQCSPPYLSNLLTNIPKDCAISFRSNHMLRIAKVITTYLSLVAGVVLYSYSSLGSNAFVYQGALTDNSNVAIAETLIRLQFEIVANSSCVVWRKSEDITTNSSGEFTVTLNDSSNELSIAFQNSNTLTCLDGGDYSPSTGEERELKVTIIRVDSNDNDNLSDDSDANVALTPSQIISAVPYAISSQVSELSETSNNVVESNIDASAINFTGADLSTVDFDGVDISGALGGAEPTVIAGQPTGDIAAATQAVENAASSNTADTIVVRDSSGNFSAGTISADLAGNADTATTANSSNALRGTNVSSTTPNSGEFLKFDGSDWVPGTLPSQTSLGTLNVDTGTLVVDDSNDRVGIGTATPGAKLEVAGGIKIGTDAATCDGTKGGMIKYNSSTKVIEYCNGTSWNQFSPGINASLTISAPSVGLTQSGPITYGITYGSGTDENTITLGTTDMSLGGSATTDCTIDSVTGTGLTRTVTISGCSATGTVDLSVNGGTAKSTTGNLAEAAGPSTSFQVDNTGPGSVGTITIGSVPASLSATPTISYGTATDTGGGTVADYEVQIKKSSDDSVIAAWASHTSGDDVTTTMSPTTDYYAEVRAVDSVGNLGSVSQSSVWTSPDCDVTPQVFAYTGSLQTFTVPAGCSQITVQAWGGGGGAGESCPTTGGKGGPGGYTEATFTTSAGTSYDVYVARGGYLGSSSNQKAGNGSGTYISGGSSAANRGGGAWGGSGGSASVFGSDLVVAAGGGGGGGCRSSAMGRNGDSGHFAGSPVANSGMYGGTGWSNGQSGAAGGTRGVYGGGYYGNSGSAGSSKAGGNGGGGREAPAGGGGGAGIVGGGGGGGSGGGDGQYGAGGAGGGGSGQGPAGVILMAGSGITPYNDGDIPAGIAVGGEASDGGEGYIIVTPSP
jgi:hypothetical protein